MDSDGCGILQMQIWGHVVSTDGIDSHLKPLPNIEKPNEHLERRALHCHSWTCLQVEVIQIIEVTWIERQSRKMHVPPNTKHIEDPNLIPNKFKKTIFLQQKTKLQRLLGSSESFESFRILSKLTKPLPPSLPPKTHIRGGSSGSSTALWEKRAEGALEMESSVQVSAWRAESVANCLTAETVENHGKSWKIPWKIMEDHGRSWKIMENLMIDHGFSLRR